jgi:hypothetical protein
MKRKLDPKKIGYWIVTYSIGYLAGHNFGTAGYWLGSILLCIIIMYLLDFGTWVFRGWKIGHQDKPVKDKFGWHNNNKNL